MESDDDTPTTSLAINPGQPTRRLGSTGRVVATAAAVLLTATAAVGAGMGLAGADRHDHGITMAARAHSSDAAGAGRHAQDSSRQAWAHQYGQAHKAMPDLPDVAAANPQQQAAAADLLARTESATAAYGDPARAVAAGYDLQGSLAQAQQRHPGLTRLMQKVDSGATPKRMPMLHVANRALLHDGKVLDPSAPETLMYEYTGHNTWKLVGVMYVANEAYPQAPPDPGGPITRWHYHEIGGGRSLMMHVFFVAGNDLAHAYALTMEGM